MEHTDIDLPALQNEVDKLQSITFCAATLKKHGQVEFTATLELIKENYEKVGKLLYPKGLFEQIGHAGLPLSEGDILGAITLTRVYSLEEAAEFFLDNHTDPCIALGRGGMCVCVSFEAAKKYFDSPELGTLSV